ncbi:MAG: DUF4292 domain-containing protein [Taibaiella sp.]|nr:DUF4292 domain-containing protein [Taibaiella sp.]
MNKFSYCYLLLLVTLLAHSSCSLQRLLKKKTTEVAVIDSSADVYTGILPRFSLPAPDTFMLAIDTIGNGIKLLTIVKPVWERRLSYNTFGAKAKVNFEGPEEKQEFTASIRLRKDSAIWVDITALGGMVHAARVLITPDSMLMINYLQKEFSKISLGDIAKILPVQVDFPTLQNLITGDPPRNGTISAVSETADKWWLSVDDGSYVQVIAYDKADSLLKTDQVNTRNTNGPEALFKFMNYISIQNKKFSANREITINNGADHFKLSLEMQRVDFDQVLDFPFSIPKNYTEKR